MVYIYKKYQIFIERRDLMRIIAGKSRGKKLKSPIGDKIRPTLDRVKENIFNIIGPKIRGSIVLDLFSGSGALGLEALSRGAGGVYFVDIDTSLTNENIALTNLVENSFVIKNSAEEAIKSFYKKAIKFDYIFMDPPYLKGIVEKTLQQLEKYNIIQDEGIVIVEMDKSEEIPDILFGFAKIKEKIYSNTRISILKRGN